jgi:hypothetical protein
MEAQSALVTARAALLQALEAIDAALARQDDPAAERQADADLTLQRAAGIAGVTIYSIRRWIKKNPTLGKKVGGRWNISAAELTRLLDAEAD